MIGDNDMFYDMKQSGARIQQLRTQNGYTQEEFSKILNIDRSNLSRIESGKRSCSLELLVQLSSLFDVTLDYLILGQGETSTSKVYDNTHLKADIEALIQQLEAFKLDL